MISDTPQAGLKTLNHRSDWQTARLKFLFKRENRSVLETDDVVTAFRDGKVTLRKNRREDGFTFAEQEIGYQGVEPGDLVIHAMDGFAGAIGVSDSRGKGSPVLSIATPTGDAEPRFWAYYLRNLAVTGFIQSLAKGIRERSTDFRWKDASNLLVNFPNLSTQRQIADFLDRETARIDLLIEKKQRLVALLGEKFLEQQRSLFYGNEYQSDESTYLSRLNPAWAISKNARHFKIRMGETILSDSVSESGRYPVYSATEGDVIFGYVENTNALLKRGDLVIPARGNSIGHVKYINQPSTSTQTTIQMSLFDGALDSEYVFCWIKAFKQYLFPFDRTAIPQITTEQVGRNPLPLAPYENQKIIVTEFRRLVEQERMLLAPTSISIERLKEYRSALITAAVTGQIDVGEWVMTGSNDLQLHAIQAEMDA